MLRSVPATFTRALPVAGAVYVTVCRLRLVGDVIHAMPATLFPLGPLAIVLVLVALERLTRATLPLDRRTEFWVAAAAVILTVEFSARFECNERLR